MLISQRKKLNPIPSISCKSLPIHIPVTLITLYHIFTTIYIYIIYIYTYIYIYIRLYNFLSKVGKKIIYSGISMDNTTMGNMNSSINEVNIKAC